MIRDAAVCASQHEIFWHGSVSLCLTKVEQLLQLKCSPFSPSALASSQLFLGLFLPCPLLSPPHHTSHTLHPPPVHRPPMVGRDRGLFLDPAVICLLTYVCVAWEEDSQARTAYPQTESDAEFNDAEFGGQVSPGEHVTC